MYFNKVMLDVVQLMPDHFTKEERNAAVVASFAGMGDALAALHVDINKGDVMRAKINVCSLVHHAVMYLHIIDVLATDVSTFEYEDAKFTPVNSNFQNMPLSSWKAHIPQWGDSMVDTHLPSLVFSIMAWCSVNNWGFTMMWNHYRRTMFEKAADLVKYAYSASICECQPIVVNPNQLDLPL